MLSRNHSVHIYTCLYEKMKTPIPRHHLSSIASCRELGVKGLDDMRELLPSSLYEELITNGETIIIDKELIEKIVGKRLNNDVYLRLILK